MMMNSVLTSSLILGVAVLLQTTVGNWIAVAGVKPDIALVILIFIAQKKGSMVAQITGFFTGLLEDLLSLSPLGFHSLMKSVIGYVYGLFRGNIFMDPIITPVVLTVIGTIGKGLLAGIIGFIFIIPAATFRQFVGKIWIEVLFNAVLAPFLFALLRFVPMFKEKDFV